MHARTGLDQLEVVGLALVLRCGSFSVGSLSLGARLAAVAIGVWLVLAHWAWQTRLWRSTLWRLVRPRKTAHCVYRHFQQC